VEDMVSEDADRDNILLLKVKLAGSLRDKDKKTLR
jgi:hypothetical protein